MAKNLQAYKLGVNITAEAARALATLREVDRQAAKTAGSLKQVKGAGGTIGGIGSGIASVAGGNAITSVLSKIAGVMDETTQAGVEYAKQIETAGVALKTLTGSADVAQRHLKDLQKFAAENPLFDFAGVTQASLKLQAFGLSADDVTKKLPAIADAAAAASAGTGDFKGALDGVVLALGQMRAKGRVSLEEINQLTERGVPALEILAKKIGKTTAETTKLIESGRGRGDVAFNLLIEGFQERYTGLSADISKTLAGKEAAYSELFQQRAAVSAEAYIREYNRRLDAALKDTNATATDMKAVEAANKVKDTLTQIGQATVDNKAGKAVGRGAQGMLGMTGAQVEDAIVDFSVKVITGINGAWAKVAETGGKAAETSGKAMGEGAEKGAKKALKIESPSQVFIEIGEQCAEGYAKGFEQWLAEHGDDQVSAALKKSLEKQFQRLASGELSTFQAKAGKSGIPLEVLLGVASRETGMRNIIGDRGRGAGMMQVDIGTDAAFKASGAWKDVDKSIQRGTEILLDKMRQLQRLAGKEVGLKDRSGRSYKFTVPKMEGEQLLQTALASYNSGMWAAYHVSKGRSPDYGTTGGDYSADVLARARAFQQMGVTGAAGRASAVEVKASKAAPLAVMLVDPKAYNAGTVTARPDLVPLSDVSPFALDRNLPLSDKRVDIPALGGTMPGAGKVVSLADYKAQKSAKENYRDFTGGGQPGGLFAGMGANIGGGITDKMTAGQGAMEGLKDSLGEVKKIGKEAFGQLAQGVGSILHDFILLGETGPGALKKVTAQVLASAAQECATLSIVELGKGFATMFTNPAESAGHFTASAIFAGIAAGTGIAGRALAGKQDKGQISEEQRRQAAISNVASEGYAGNRFERREFGGDVMAGRSYLVGEKRAEVVQFPTNGRVYPSVSEYERKRSDLTRLRSGLAEHSVHGVYGRLIQRMIEKLDAQFARLEAVKGDDVFLRVMDRNPRAVARATVSGMDQDDQLSNRMGRRIA